MTAQSKLIPSGSQTVGPYFRIGLQHLIDRRAAAPIRGFIEIHGCVIDCDGTPVSDAMLEFWGADSSGNYPDSGQIADDLPTGFWRAATDMDGCFSISIPKPGLVPFGDARFQAPHCLVLVFARGLLRHLVTRVYFGDEPANSADPVLLKVPAGRRHTLIARADGENRHSFHWNVVLQGDNETAFFDW